MDQFHEEPRTRSERHQKTWLQRTRKWLILFGFIFILLLTVITAIAYGGKLIVKESDIIVPATSTIETENGEVLWELYEENRKLVPIERVPLHVQHAFIAIEDRRFYSHGGVDFRSIMRAVYRDIIARSKVEGASTITQQLAKNLFLSNEKTWLRKTKEVMIAIYLEREYTKDEILEMYMNTIYFGHGVYGVEAAANYFFSKKTDNLSLEEGALLAGLAKAPNSYSPVEYPEKAKQRRDTVLHAMADVGQVTKKASKETQESPIQLNIHERKRHPSVDSYVDLVLKEAIEKYNLSLEQIKRNGYRIVVAMQPSAQKIAYEQMKNDNYFPGNTSGVEGAFVMMEHTSGKIVSALGGRNYQFGDLNRLYVERQPGSTMKPIAVYGPAMMKDSFGPHALVPDQLIDWDGYQAKNYDNQYEGSVSVYNAITYSKNAPTVWLLDYIGIDYAKEYLQKMGIQLEDNGLAIALGGLKYGVTPLQLTEAYATFASEGVYKEGYTIVEVYNRDNERIEKAVSKTKKVFNKQVAWNMTEMLKHVVENGTAKKGTYTKELAGKTGSTSHPDAKDYYKDAWFAGYTPEYTFASWIGYDQSDKGRYLTAGSPAAVHMTKAILTEIDKKQSLQAKFTKPDGVKTVERPINLSKVNGVDVTYQFGGLSILKGKITWELNPDERIIYRIYQEKKGLDERIGEVTGENEFIIDNVSLWDNPQYYIVPYDPLTKVEGEHSEIVQLRLGHN